MLMLMHLFAFLIQTQTSTSTVIDPNTFSFISFSPESCTNGELLCMGSATSGNGYLSLTPEPQPQQNNNSSLPSSSTTNKIGRVLYPHPVHVWPAIISTTFTLRITPFTKNSTSSGDGMALVFAQDNRPSPNHSYGSYLGLFDKSTQGGVFRQIAVEMDTFMNEFDPDGNHIGIVTTSITNPVAFQSLNSTGVDLKSGRDIVFKIDYDGWNNMIFVSVGYSRNQLKSVMNHSITLPDIIPSTVYVGFTASTGMTIPETHQVLNWVFTSVPLPILSVEPRKVDTFKIILIIVIPVFVLISLFPFMWKAWKKIYERGHKEEDIESISRTVAYIPKMFTYKQLLKATCNFSKENLLGRGGFGGVYKGIILDTGKTIAVKKISANSKQGEKEFLAEICTIGRLRHKNLVQLQGWCNEGKNLLLVYDYMQNGSLDHFIGKDVLDWKTRHKILTGLASALLYLHEECGNPVVHRDVKPNNVMLDSDFNAHLGDFGLARLLKNEDSVTTNFAGTPGYLAPEIGFTGKASPESDVYSFGMVVLEVICGKRSRWVMEENSLVDCVWNLHGENALLECVDKLLENQFDEEQAKRALMVGLACLHPDSLFRPKMRKVVHIFLNSNEPLMELPRMRPTGVYVTVSSRTSITDFGSRGELRRLQSSTTSLDETCIVDEV
ncbi:probable L-type lectin-domain containing receptor kinase S.5 [Gastrolobium bilobum]|uniref:probable L-type lectin-domain containing receptor kinase S.5 n=1 Tax=Gastrolobium bilobum TaxID=150636 RepID=UPI002AB2ADE8|nr:probable L-type lectin-domain containing receptor kinase S.5 [Gastrolobium bilobum]